MRKGFLLALGALLAEVGVALGQAYVIGTPIPYQPPAQLSAIEVPPSAQPQAPPEAEADPDAGKCSRFWVRGEYLLWWVSDGPAPPLVTTGDPTVNPAPGALGASGTRVLFGGSFDYGSFSGGRLAVGAWLGEEGIWGLEASGFLLERRAVGFSAASDAAGNPPIYLPYFRIVNDREGSLTIADPLWGFNGKIAVTSSTHLWGGELNGLLRVSEPRPFDVKVLAGFRYLHLGENLAFAGNFNDFVLNQQNTYTESFTADNDFFGGQLGVCLGYHFGRWQVDLIGKVALGSTHQVLDASGTITRTTLVSSGTFDGGGLYVQPTNLGRQVQDQFTVIPEIQLRVGYDISPRLRVSIGYDFLFWPQVIRPGNQIDRSVNTSQVAGGVLVGPAHPAPIFRRSDFFVHGVNFGLEFRF